jgi:hypothetical protein
MKPIGVKKTETKTKVKKGRVIEKQTKTGKGNKKTETKKKATKGE